MIPWPTTGKPTHATSAGAGCCHHTLRLAVHAKASKPARPNESTLTASTQAARPEAPGDPPCFS